MISYKLAGEDSTYAIRMRERREALAARLATIFSQKRVFTWEIGCGHGHFLAAYAAANPDRLCVGIDIMGERIARAERKRDRAKLENLFFLHAEGRLFLNAMPAGVAASETFILFPDPWPKVRHHKHRIVSPEFLRAAAERSTNDARLYFRTDYTPYFEAVRRDVFCSPDWDVAEEEWPFEYNTVFQSRAPAFHSLIVQRRQACQLQA